jgi:DNA-binding transcriptional LysR family regulator
LAVAPQTLSEAVRRFEAETTLTLLERSDGMGVVRLSGFAVDETLMVAFQGLCDLARLCNFGRRPADQEHWAATTGLNVDALQRLVLVAKMGSIRGAALAAGLHQPQLSRQLKHIEEKLGVCLLQRSAKGVQLTAVGHLLLPRLEQLIGLWATLQGAGDVRFQRMSRAVRVGSILQTSPESHITQALSQVVIEWIAAHPQRPISVRAMPADTLREALRARRLDVVLIDAVEGLEEFSVKTVLETDLVAIAPADSCGTSFADLLKRHSLCLTSERTGLGQAFAQLTGYLPEGMVQMPMVEIESLPVLVNLVVHHGFVSLLGRLSAESLGKRVKIVELPRKVSFSFYIVHNGTSSAVEVSQRLFSIFRAFSAR